jgi:uncharacterized protein YxeA
MKCLTAIICAAIVGGAIIYHARTRPGRYYFPNTWENVRAADTATGKMYYSETRYDEKHKPTGSTFETRDPVRECFKWPWE